MHPNIDTPLQVDLVCVVQRKRAGAQDCAGAGTADGVPAHAAASQVPLMPGARHSPHGNSGRSSSSSSPCAKTPLPVAQLDVLLAPDTQHGCTQAGLAPACDGMVADAVSSCGTSTGSSRAAAAAANGAPQTPGLGCEPACSQPSAEPLMLSQIMAAPGMHAALSAEGQVQELGIQGSGSGALPCPPTVAVGCAQDLPAAAAAVAGVAPCPLLPGSAGVGTPSLQLGGVCVLPEAGGSSVSRAPPPFATSIFFARVPPTVPYESILALFQGFGEVVSLNLFRPWATAKTSKGCGIVEFATAEAAMAAMTKLHQKFHWTGGETTMVCEWTDPARHRKEHANTKGVFEAKHKTNPTLRGRNRPGLMRGRGPGAMQGPAATAALTGTRCGAGHSLSAPLPSVRGVAAMMPQLAAASAPDHGMSQQQWWHSVGAAAAASQAYVGLVASAGPISDLARLVMQQQAVQGSSAVGAAPPADGAVLPGVGGTAGGCDATSHMAGPGAASSLSTGYGPWGAVHGGCSATPAGDPCALPAVPALASGMPAGPYNQHLLALQGQGVSPACVASSHDAAGGRSMPSLLQSPLNLLSHLDDYPHALAAIKAGGVLAGVHPDAPLGAPLGPTCLADPICGAVGTPTHMEACSLPSYASGLGSNGGASVAGEAAAAQRQLAALRGHAYGSTGSLPSMGSAGQGAALFLSTGHNATVTASLADPPYIAPGGTVGASHLHAASMLAGLGPGRQVPHSSSSCGWWL